MSRVHRRVRAAFAIFPIVAAALVPHAVRALDDEAGAEDGCYKIANYSDVPAMQRMNEGLAKLYEAAGLCVRVESMPTQRAQGLMLQGRIDGQLLRTGAWVEKYGQNLVVVRPPLISARAILFAGKGTEIPNEPVQTLVKGQPVAVRKATRWTAAWVSRHGGKPVYVHSRSELRRLFDAGRVKLGLYLVPVSHLAAEARRYNVREIGPVDFFHVLKEGEEETALKLGETLKKLGGSRFMEAFVLPLEPDRE